MILSYTFRGLTFSTDGSSPFHVQTIDGLSVPAPRSSDGARAGADGDNVGQDHRASRDIVIAVDVVGDEVTPVQTYLRQLAAAWSNPAQNLFPFAIEDETWPVPSVIAWCRPRKLDYQLDRNYVAGIVSVDLELYAPDSRLYEDPQNVVTTTPYAGAGGFKFPLKFPLKFTGGSGGSSGVVTVTNDGDVETYPILVLHGYAEGPVIENTTTGERMALDLNIAATDYVVVDMLAHTVMLNGVASYYGAKTSDSTFFALQPGPNALRFHATGLIDNNALATVNWRGAWY